MGCAVTCWGALLDGFHSGLKKDVKERGLGKGVLVGGFDSQFGSGGMGSRVFRMRVFGSGHGWTRSKERSALFRRASVVSSELLLSALLVCLLLVALPSEHDTCIMSF